MQLPLAKPDNLEKLKRLCVAVVAVLIVVAIAAAPPVFEYLILAFAVTSILIGAAIASVSVWRRNRGVVFGRQVNAPPRKQPTLFGPDMLILHRVHLGAPIGGVLALGLAIFL